MLTHMNNDIGFVSSKRDMRQDVSVSVKSVTWEFEKEVVPFLRLFGCRNMLYMTFCLRYAA